MWSTVNDEPATGIDSPSERSTSHRWSGWVSSHSGRSSGCSRIGAVTASRSASATRTWSSWAWVHTIAVTRRSPTTARMPSTEWGASITTQLSSSPTTQTLLSTSKV